MKYDDLDMDMDFAEVWLKHAPIQTWDHLFGEWAGMDEQGFIHLDSAQIITKDDSEMIENPPLTSIAIRIEDVSMIVCSDGRIVEYTPAETVDDHDWRTRLLEERDQLESRLSKLDNIYVDTAKTGGKDGLYRRFGKQQALLMARQLIAMHDYLDILEERIKASFAGGIDESDSVKESR